VWAWFWYSAWVSAACADDGAASTITASPAGEAVGDIAVVTLESGQVQGDVVEAGVRRYLKIPYAKPPVDGLRWKPPAAPEGWSGVRHETQFANACAQNASSGSKTSLNEDCLYLNVWTPDPKPASAPVMVWIHGGGNFAGGTDDKVPMTERLWFDGRLFAQRHGIVVVTLNYRLGPLGFFAHPQLASEGSNVGNQGLLDQNFALQWVKRNIAAFGGDPQRVTIFGESAGSSDVCYHVASPRSAGLFRSAISESGGCTADLGRISAPSEAAAALRTFVDALGCGAAADALGCLRAKPIDAIMANAMQPQPTSGMTSGPAFSFPVVTDGSTGFLPKSAREIFDAGEMNRVAYVLGSNTDEGSLFVLGVSGPATEAEYQAQLSARFGAFAERVAAAYPVAKFGGDYRAALTQVVGDSGLICGTHDSARRAAKAGLQTYMYNFNVPWTVGAGVLGVAHASEISHVFGVPYMADAQSQSVADQINDYWANFALHGDPNSAGSPAKWPAFAPDASDNDQRLQLDANWKVLDNFRKDECALWRMRYATEP
jgi:para-nitrobenzyl esterase